VFSLLVDFFLIKGIILYFMNHHSKIGFYDLIIISFSGMIRGAIAFALIVDHDSENAYV
jgi:hypothetical protein